MSIIKSKSQQETNILSELNSFLVGAAQVPKSNPLDLSKNALILLKNLPTARDAILEYFCYLFDIAVSNYVIRIETEIATGQMPSSSSREETTVAEIHMVLCTFVNQNPQAWAPVISTWSLELLGELSTKYAGRAHVSVSAGLNEILQLWMGCRSTRTLIDITTQCLTNLMNTDSETWMNALLNTSVKHSPNFDWVVAHVGSCFPNTVITRVLSCGLKDFCQYKNIETGSKAPKLTSVVGILSHLAGSHFSDIRLAILELFSWSVRPYDLLDLEVKIQKLSTVPFLLQLATLSPTLLKAVTSNIQHTLRGNIIYQLYGYINDWCKYFSSSKNLQDIIISLILKTEQDGIQIINLLLYYVFFPFDLKYQHAALFIKQTAHEILEFVLQEMDCYVRTQQTCNLLISLMDNLPCLFKLLLKSEQLVYETAARLLMMLGKINQHFIIKASCFLFKNSKTDNHLAMAVRMMSLQNMEIGTRVDQNISSQFLKIYTQIVKETMLEIMNEKEINCFTQDNCEQFWLNLLTVLKWEKSKKVFLLGNDITFQAICNNMDDIILLFGNLKYELKVSHIIAEILFIFFSYNTTISEFSPNLIYNLTNSAVNYFFLCCTEPNKCLKEKGMKLVNEIFNKISMASKVARIIALRELLERCIFKKENLLFGADIQSQKNNFKMPHSLLTMNHKRSTTMMLAQRHSSIFHAGIIGSGCRKSSVINPIVRDDIATNTDYLILAIKSCCLIQQTISDTGTFKKSPISLEALTTVSLMFVQFVSPDLMYSGLPWPEEEFSKVTIERDLYIRRLFTKSPVIWELMSFIALYRPVLCYCSVLLRALTATLLHQWNNTRFQTNISESSDYKILLDNTVKLIDLMSIGQLLPPPLCHMRDVIILLKPNETVQLLRDCIWNYMKDHIPSPELFTCDSFGLHWRDSNISRPQSLYSDTLRIIMQFNIDKLGDQYVQLFYSR